MNILVTGATGFIGLPLALYLAQNGNIVHAFCRSQGKAKLLNHPRIKVFYGDLLDKESIRIAMKGCEKVFHLAAYVKMYSKDPHKSHKINVIGTRNIVEAAKTVGVKKIVITSTAAVFGPSIDDEVITEDTIRQTPFFTQYEQTKQESIQQLETISIPGIELVVVYPTRVYGPGIMNQSNIVTKQVKWFLKYPIHFIPGDPKMFGNYVYIKDIVNGHILAMEKGENGEGYLLCGENLTFEKFFRTLNTIHPKRYLLVGLPIKFLLLFSHFLHILDRFFGIPPIFTKEWVYRYRYNYILSNQKAKEKLGFSVTPLQNGLEKTIKWLTSNKNGNG